MMRRVILPALLFAGQASAQGASVGLSTGELYFGRVTPEVTSYVRIGEGGRDRFYQLDIDRTLTGGLGLTGALLVAPTHVYSWTKEGGELGRTWDLDEQEAVRVEKTLWSCLTLGLRHRPVSWVQGSAGAGVCSVSGASYRRFGAVPMNSAALQAGMRVSRKVGPVAVQADCDVYPIYASRATGQPFTVYRDHAGYTDKDAGYWMLPVKCGAGVRLGG